MSRRSDPGAGCLVVFWAIGLLIYGSWSFAGAYANDHTETCTVTSMDRAGAAGNSDARLYTRECGTLQIRDSWLRGRTDSADLWGRIGEGERYRMRIVGFRFGLTSTFPNVLDAQPVPLAPIEGVPAATLPGGAS